jgi:hypothetical protein
MPSGHPTYPPSSASSITEALDGCDAATSTHSMTSQEHKEASDSDVAQSQHTCEIGDCAETWGLLRHTILQHIANEDSIQNTTLPENKQEMLDNMANLQFMVERFDPKYPGASLAEERVGKLGTVNPNLAREYVLLILP